MSLHGFSKRAGVRLSCVRGLATHSEELKKTVLYDFHVENGAKMVPFGGYVMPLAYDGIDQVASHNHVRTSAGIFDIGHAVQTKFRGRTATAFFEWMTPSELSNLTPYTSMLSLVLNEKGGILDDAILIKHSDETYYMVSNAGQCDIVIKWFTDKLKEWNSSERGRDGPVELELMNGWGLLALQGPKASSYLQSLTSFDLSTLTFGKCAYVPIKDFNLHVARRGYTGEDGFEISIPPDQIVETAKLLSQRPVRLTGFGVKDSLRLEAGMCWYGNDLDEGTTPVEAGLGWVIGKSRRESGGFIGAESVIKQLKQGPPRRRVGLFVEGVPPQQGDRIFADQSHIGTITSGMSSPTLGKNIAMGYVRSGLLGKRAEVEVKVQDRLRRAVLTPMPFVKPKYWRG